ncbi:acid ceramidase-like isoform X2 [Babylonia areolata]|uniref:acid ceramidase-like isoform X2 n=1 Tax=Babylonia areolata TaxID=304850 RepID=UPI003FCF615E
MIREAVILCFVILTISVAGYKHFEGDCVKDAYPPKSGPSVPWFTINLDLEPDERWKDVAIAYKVQIATFLNTFKSLLRDISSHAEDIITLDIVESTLPYPFAQEIRGISYYSGLDLGEIALSNVIYELTSLCTSILAEDRNGNLVHARNLDTGAFVGWDVQNKTWPVTEALRPMVINLDFRRGGKTVFQSVSFAGYVGILTAIKPKQFSLTLNARFSWKTGFLGVLKWLMGYRRGQWMGFLTRSVMENATSYGQALTLLNTTPLLAPVYFVLGAARCVDQAVIITRSQQAPGDVLQMSSVADHPWFIVQTSYDHWTTPFFLDDRRSPAVSCLKNITKQEIGFAGLYNVLSTQPVLNKATTYTALMEVSSGRLETYVRYCRDPCFPW